MGSLTSVSVLLPAWNERRLLGRCLESLLSLDWPCLEVIVSAGGEDGTYDEARRYAGTRVTVIEQRRGEGKQRALRRCLAEANGEVIYLTDADCVVPQEAFWATLRPVCERQVDAATGLSVPLPEQRGNPLVRYQWGKDISGTRRHGAFAHGVLGRNCAIRRSLFDALQLLTQDVPSGTDFHVSQMLRKAGVKIAWADSFVFSQYPTTASAYVRMWRRWIKNVLVQGIAARSIREVRITGVGVASGMAILSAPMLFPVFGRRLALLWLALFGGVTLRRAAAHQREVRAGRIPPLDHPGFSFPAFVVLDSVAAVAGLVAAIVPSMRGRW